jgi:hypothetical protein
MSPPWGFQLAAAPNFLRAAAEERHPIMWKWLKFHVEFSETMVSGLLWHGLIRKWGAGQFMKFLGKRHDDPMILYET